MIRRPLALVGACLVGVLVAAAEGKAQPAPGTERVSLRSDGTEADANSRASSVSADGRFVVFMAASLVRGP